MDESEVNVSLVAPDEAEKVEDNDSVETFESALDNEDQNKFGETTASMEKDQNFIEVGLMMPTEPKSQEELEDKLEEQDTEVDDNNEMPESSSSQVNATDALEIKEHSFDEPMEQDTSEKAPENEQTSINESISFTEKSINISQINVSLNNDDSNDAFNALKESEEDALNTKEEPEEVKDEEAKEEEDEGTKEDEVKEKESAEDEASVSMPAIESADITETEKVFDCISSNDVDLEDNVDSGERQDSVLDDAMDVDDKPLDEDRNDDNEAAEDDGGTTETTTEQEGVDENVCLLGDVEREITDADKERAVLTTEAPEDDEEAMAIDKDTETDPDVTEDISTEKEVDAEEQTEMEEQTDSDVPIVSQPLKENEIREIVGEITEKTCLNCENLAECNYELLEDATEVKHLCTYNCVVEHCEDNPDKYFVTQKKVTIFQILPATQSCCKCNEEKSCKYRFRVSKPQSSVPIVEAKSTETEAPEADIADVVVPAEVTDEVDESVKEVPVETSDAATEVVAEDAEASAPAVIVSEPISYKYVCDDKCLEDFVNKNTDKYTIKRKRHLIDEIVESVEDFKCLECAESKKCQYKCTQQDNTDAYICNEICLNLLLKEHPDSYRVKRRSIRVREPPQSVKLTEAELEPPKIVARTDSEVECARLDRDQSFIRRCRQCFDVVSFTKRSIQWETFDFCDAKCLGLYQNLIGATCATCCSNVTLPCIGKFCVRFGFDLKQFCCSGCLDVYKKAIKQCALCLEDLSLGQEILLAQCGEKKAYKDFCNQICLKRYEEIINPKRKPTSHICAVCNNKKPARIEVQVDGGAYRLCSNPCFSAFKFVNNVVPDQCDMCMKYFERKQAESHTIYDGDATKMFCTRICMNVFVSTSRKIWQCNWCRVSKYNYDMIQSDYGKDQMCSLNCLTLYEVSIDALTQKRTKCAHCKILKQPQYHLTMSDSSIRNFCTYQCVLGFQSQFNKKTIGDEPMVVPAGTAKRIKAATTSSFEESKLGTKDGRPMISRVQSFSTRQSSRLPYNPTVNRPRTQIPVPELTVQLERIGDLPARVKVSSLSSLTGGAPSFTAIPTSPARSLSPEVRVENKTQVVTIPPLPKPVSNVSTMCKAIMLNKAISCKVSTKTAECQTDDYLERTLFLPIPIPVFVPQPMMMYSTPVPIPVPFVLPIPCPVFIPTTRNSASGIMKEIKKIQEKMPTDPYEAELLIMAEMVAGDKKREETDSDSDNEVTNEIEYGDGIENNSSFNEDLVQMAFKMASGNDFDDPPVDLESEMTANTISQNTHPYDDMDPHSLHHHQLLLLQQQREAAAAAAAIQSGRGRKRMPAAKQINNSRNSAPNKRIKREMEVLQQDIPREPAEKPDANMCLKYTFGVNAWKQWVATKNADFEKSSIRRKPIKSEILQLTADELNYSLCMFVKEVRKPNGSEYAPDTIYYLVLGIQQYLYENGRIDNIFTDRYYEQFTDCLDEVAKKFSVLYNDSQYIVTRVEEEHLWECKQLGAHSPHVLLSTLMFFNTKHFNLVTVDEHMELSFSHIMKHWKRNPNQPGAAKMPGSRNVLLRFYPPQSSLEANSRKKKVYEQQENEDNPLRCPVKLYEFYLSKCPESVKTRNDVFYLQPERSCVPDSPVWYSTQPLSRDALSKMLHRVKMVKEINIALLTS